MGCSLSANLCYGIEFPADELSDQLKDDFDDIYFTLSSDRLLGSVYSHHMEYHISTSLVIAESVQYGYDGPFEVKPVDLLSDRPDRDALLEEWCMSHNANYSQPKWLIIPNFF